MTLLDVVQNIMSALSLEEVNSIEDRVESVQIAEIARETYYQIMSDKDWSFSQKLFSLSSLNDANLPVVLAVPANVTNIEYVKYKNVTKDKTEAMIQLSPEDFLSMLDERSSNVANITLVTYETFDLKIRNDKSPEYFTSFDQTNIVFDSFESNVSSTVQAAKTLCLGTVVKPFSVEDDFEIPLPEDMLWTYFLPEVKSIASINILQQANNKEQQRSNRGRWRSYYANPKTKKEGKYFPDYGRK